MGLNIDETYGSIKISDEVIAATAAIAAVSIDGVAEMSGGITESISSIIGKTNLSKGIKVNTNDDNVIIDIFITVKYGVKIPEVAWNVQEKVKKEVEDTAGIKIKAINIHVQGVAFETEDDTGEAEDS